jgi:hypothetical protein
MPALALPARPAEKRGGSTARRPAKRRAQSDAEREPARHRARAAVPARAARVYRAPDTFIIDITALHSTLLARFTLFTRL